VQYKWPLPGHITTDPLRVKQVLINLLSNAIKFTARGWIELKVEYEKFPGQIFFTVTDSGIGISEEQSRLLFRPFFQANESITRQYGGSGLGLSISRRLANALGGDITVVTAAGKGSSFKFWLSPCIGADDSLINEVPSEQVESPLSAPAKTFSGKVLFADDALDNRRLVNHLLEKAGVLPTLVEDGRQAVDAVLKESFDLILLDVQMPHVDGLSAARAIRQAGIKAPIVALSAGAMTSDVLKAIDAGCSMHLSKPFSKEGFIGMLERFLPIAVLAAPQDNSLATPILTTKDLLDDDTLPLVIEFVGKLPEKLCELESTAHDRDSAKLASLAHRLRGSAGLYGYPELSELCGMLEKLAKTNPNEPTAPLVSEIATVIQRIRAGCPAPKSSPTSDARPVR
jgi:CheY-like chemotaxis protein